MALTIALTDGIHHKSIVETVPYSIFHHEEAQYLISGTVVDSRLRGYCEITVIAPSNFYTILGFFDQNGRIVGHTLYTTNDHKEYGVVYQGTVNYIVFQDMKRQLRIITTAGVKTTFIYQNGSDTITKSVVSGDERTTRRFRGNQSWFDAIINISDWDFLKNRSIIGKTERVPEDPFYSMERRHLPFEARNTAPAENAPAGIQ